MTDEQILKQIGSKIKKARLERGMSRQRLSQLTMTDYSNLVSIERGKKNSKILTYALIAEKLGLGLKDLL